MSSARKILANIPKIRHFSLTKRNLTGGRIIFNKVDTPASNPSSRSSTPNVPGLSKNVVKVPSEPVGPGASKSGNYPNPEYFCYDKNSYYEAEVEMLKYRCPQPSVHKYFEPSISK